MTIREIPGRTTVRDSSGPVSRPLESSERRMTELPSLWNYERLEVSFWRAKKCQLIS